MCLAIILRGLGVLTGQQVNVTVVYRRTVHPLQVATAGHISTCDGIGVDRIISGAAGNRSVSSILSLRHSSGLRSHYRVNKRSNESYGQGSGSNGGAAATYSSTLKILLSHAKKSFP